MDQDEVDKEFAMIRLVEVNREYLASSVETIRAKAQFERSVIRAHFAGCSDFDIAVWGRITVDEARAIIDNRQPRRPTK